MRRRIFGQDEQDGRDEQDWGKNRDSLILSILVILLILFKL